jgi:hypothetical protein
MKTIAVSALLTIMAYLAFWGTVIFVIAHFIGKFW